MHLVRQILPIFLGLFVLSRGVASFDNDDDKPEDPDQNIVPLSSRDSRMLSTFRTIGGVKIFNRKTEMIYNMKNRIDSMMEKIDNIEDIRAKKSDIAPLIKLLKKLSNICPPNTNSLPVGDKCYEHQTLYWMDYDSASIYCKSRGGFLARPDVTDSLYLDKLRNIFPSVGDESVLCGITDILHEGHFEFLDGTPVAPDRFFGGAFPENDDEDCVSLIYTPGFSLADTSCKQLHEVLCEYEKVNLLPELFGKHYIF